MSVETEGLNIIQLSLFDFQKTSSGSIELFPKVWAAAEALSDQNPAIRSSGLDLLAEIQAARFSPLIAYLLFTRIPDPDMSIRTRVVKQLAEIFLPDADGNLAPEQVRQNLDFHLSQMQLTQVLALLEADAVDSSLDQPVAKLLRSNCEAGNLLMEILANRKMPLKLRERAAFFIVRVGFVEAIPGIDRLIGRLENRINGQQSFLFSSPGDNDELDLLPTLRTALEALQAP